MSTQYQHKNSPPEQPQAAREASRTALLENQEVLVMATTYPPAGSVPTHTHRFPSVVCVIEGGTLETTTPDGAVERYDVRPGEALWSGSANTHSARNVGTTPIKIVEIEVKHAGPGPKIAPQVVAPANLDWKQDPADPGRTRALLVGAPEQPGPYTVRFRAPAGYEIKLHLHPNDDEQLTVLSGAVRWSSGEAGSGAPEYELRAGGFALAPAGTPHRIVALEDTVLQMSGIGPRTYVYLDGAEDLQANGYRGKEEPV